MNIEHDIDRSFVHHGRASALRLPFHVITVQEEKQPEIECVCIG
jgi:hypothetical protein